MSFYSNEDIFVVNKKVLKTTLYFSVTVVILNFLHTFPSAPAFYRGETSRYTLGFIHPNAVGHFAIIIAGCLFLRDYKKEKGNTLICLVGLAIVPYVISNCRTALHINFNFVICNEYGWYECDKKSYSVKNQ